MPGVDILVYASPPPSSLHPPMTPHRRPLPRLLLQPLRPSLLLPLPMNTQFHPHPVCPTVRVHTHPGTKSLPADEKISRFRLPYLPKILPGGLSLPSPLRPPLYTLHLPLYSPLLPCPDPQCPAPQYPAPQPAPQCRPPHPLRPIYQIPPLPPLRLFGRHYMQHSLTSSNAPLQSGE